MAYTYSKLASTTVGAGGASAITFSNIPQNYTDLVLKISTRSNVAGDTWSNVWLTFNGNTATYSSRLLSGLGSSTYTTSETSAAKISLLYTTGNAATVNTFANGEIYIPNYSTNNNKSVSVDMVTENNATAALAGMLAGLWGNVSVISSLSLSPYTGSFLQYSTATLYGIRVEL